MMRGNLKYWTLAIVAAAFAGCCIVDEDLSDCEKDCRISYEVRLITNLETELQAQKSSQPELTPVTEALRDHLKGIFTDYAHDVSLSFYSAAEDSVLLHKEAHIMDANRADYTLYIPVRKYVHLALANTNPSKDGTSAISDVELLGEDKCPGYLLEQQVGSAEDVIPSQTTGIYSGRLPMEVKENEDQGFDMKLYMVNCASAVALDTLGSGIKAVKVYSSGYANGFRLADSSYYYKFNPRVAANEVAVSDGRFVCYSTVNFPSRDTERTRTVIDSDAPFASEVSSEPLWQYMIYAATTDGSITETVLKVKLPLRAGQFKLLRAKVDPDGSVVPREAYVGASVTLKWNERPGWEIEF